MCWNSNWSCNEQTELELSFIFEWWTPKKEIDGGGGVAVADDGDNLEGAKEDSLKTESKFVYPSIWMWSLNKRPYWTLLFVKW